MENDDTGWFERFQAYRASLLDSINREYWKDYLDFDVLDEWRNSPEPSKEERQHCINIAVKLSECLQYQNMVEVVKKELMVIP